MTTHNPNIKERQRALAWSLYQVRGAKANLFPRNVHLPEEVYVALREAVEKLNTVDVLIQQQLRHPTKTVAVAIDD